MKTKQISEIEEIAVLLHSTVRMHEEAMKQALDVALMRFGIDDCGHSSCVEEWERSCCSVRVSFRTVDAFGGMTGWSYRFLFHAWCEKYVEDEEEPE